MRGLRIASRGGPRTPCLPRCGGRRLWNSEVHWAVQGGSLPQQSLASYGGARENLFLGMEPPHFGTHTYRGAGYRAQRPPCFSAWHSHAARDWERDVHYACTNGPGPASWTRLLMRTAAVMIL